MRRAIALWLAVVLIAAAGCGADGGASTSSGSRSGTTLTVFAAASLQGVFSRLGTTFEAAHPGTTVTFSFAGSSDLVTQLQGGARADVFASADSSTMAKAGNDGLVAGQPVTFATNTLEIAVPPGNPAQVSSFADLGRPGLKLVTCAAQVPCGAAAQRIETVTGVALSPVSEESSVTDVLNKVATGEADAGLVYATDVLAAGQRVTGVQFREAKQAVNRYPIAVLSGSSQQDLAGEFVSLVRGEQGRQVLRDAGFGS